MLVLLLFAFVAFVVSDALVVLQHVFVGLFEFVICVAFLDVVVAFVVIDVFGGCCFCCVLLV